MSPLLFPKPGFEGIKGKLMVIFVFDIPIPPFAPQNKKHQSLSRRGVVKLS